MTKLLNTLPSKPTLTVLLALLLKVNIGLADSNTDQIPNLLGTWSGENKTYSDKKGYAQWKKTIQITAQNGRLFQGQFSYAEATKQFFGVIYPDNISFTWVAVDSQGYNHGRIHSGDKISACYTEAGADATVGGVELIRKSQ